MRTAKRACASLGEASPIDEKMLAPVSNREILTGCPEPGGDLSLPRRFRPAHGSDGPHAPANPGSARLHRERARMLTQAGEYRRALRDLTQVRRLRPAHAARSAFAPGTASSGRWPRA